MTSCRDLGITNKDVYFTKRVNSIVYKAYQRAVSNGPNRPVDIA